MSTNKYFKSNFTGIGEQSLLNNLIRESIQTMGYDVLYLPRETINLDYLYGEDAQSKFTDAIEIEAYIKDTGGYGGAGDTLAKFGLDIQDDLTLQIHIQRFADEITNIFPKIIRPREGDLIYFKLDTHSIFEITFVENKKPFYQAGQIYIYELSLKRFVYGAETIDTGYNEIDDIVEYGSNVDIVLGLLQSTSGTFKIGEVAYQSNSIGLNNSIASGLVLEQVNGVLTLHKVKGTFVGGKNIIGDTSGVTYTYPVKSDTTFDDSTNDKVADNMKLRKETNTILDFNEKNPFLDTDYR